MVTTVSLRGHTNVPSKILKNHKIRPKSKLEWIDDGITIRVIPIPSDIIRSSKGITMGLRQKLKKERELERQRG